MLPQTLKHNLLVERGHLKIWLKNVLIQLTFLIAVSIAVGVQHGFLNQIPLYLVCWNLITNTSYDGYLVTGSNALYQIFKSNFSWRCFIGQSPNHMPWIGWISPRRQRGTTWTLKSCQFLFLCNVYMLAICS